MYKDLVKIESNKVVELKQGDKVGLVVTRFGVSTCFYRTVKHVTKTRVILNCGARFKRESGNEYGRDDFTYRFLVHITEPFEEICDLQNADATIQKTKFAELTPTTRLKIQHLILVDKNYTQSRKG